MDKPFNIDFFELMFLAETIIPPAPIARSMAFDELSDVHYHKMDDNQRKQMFKYIINNDRFDLNDEDCIHFHSRYSPENQYIVKVDYNNEIKQFECYFHDNKYHVFKNKSIDEKYIIEVNNINKL